MKERKCTALKLDGGKKSGMEHNLHFIFPEKVSASRVVEGVGITKQLPLSSPLDSLALFLAECLLRRNGEKERGGEAIKITNPEVEEEGVIRGRLKHRKRRKRETTKEDEVPKS